MMTTRDLEAARRELDEAGGVLLDFGEGVYYVCPAEEAAEMRAHLGGMEYVKSLAPTWDETRVSKDPRGN
jgi:hypothetical protein